MLARVLSAALRGVDSYPVEVEVNLASGLPAFSVVGLPAGAVREGRERVLAALGNCGVALPPRRVTVNLAPADVPKEGSAFDLPIAVGLAAGAGVLPAECLEGWALVGELGLDGRVRGIRGALPVADRCKREGLSRLVVPRENACEAALTRGLEVFGAETLDGVIEHFRGRVPLPRFRAEANELSDGSFAMAGDFSEVRGQESVKRALEVAAAGGHNVLLVGPPGAGKTMLARRLPGILPPMTLDEALEVTRVHSVAGLLGRGRALVPERPFRTPHHTISDAGLAGGGNPPRPGEVSLAHRGVLFLDELPEFRRNVLETLRQPLEDGSIVITRSRHTVRFPARVMLVAAMNPCPCGYYGDRGDRCVCLPGQVGRYRSRVSGPLLDRFDLQVEVPAVSFEELSGEAGGEGSDTVRERVVRARARQAGRTGHGGPRNNAAMGPSDIARWCRHSGQAVRLLGRALNRFGLSARAYHRVLRLARTLADLEGSSEVKARHVAEAIQYRSLDRPLSG